MEGAEGRWVKETVQTGDGVAVCRVVVRAPDFGLWFN